MVDFLLLRSSVWLVSASRNLDVSWARAPTSRHSVGFAMARWARTRFALPWVYLFLFFLCRVGFSNRRMSDVGLSDVGLSDVGLLWKWVSAVFGGALDQAGHKRPTQAPQPPRPFQRK